MIISAAVQKTFTRLIVGGGAVGIGITAGDAAIGALRDILESQAKAAYATQYPGPPPSFDDPTWDAFRHSYTSSRLTRLFGEDGGQFFMDAVEAINMGNILEPEELLKDFYNNDKAAELFGDEPLDVTDFFDNNGVDLDLAEGIKDAISRGDIKVDPEEIPDEYTHDSYFPDMGSIAESLMDFADKASAAFNRFWDAITRDSGYRDLDGDGRPDGIPAFYPFDPTKPDSNPPPKSPLILDLNGNGVEISSLGEYGTYFDLNSDGQAELTAWAMNGDGFLVRDLNANDQIDNNSELFGSEDADGFSVLRTLDSNNDGKISSADTEWSSLKVWIDANMDGKVQDGELKTLGDLDIVSISLDAELKQGEEINGSQVTHVSTFKTSDGGDHTIVDAWLDHDPAVTRNNTEYDFDIRAALLPTLLGSGLLKDLHIAVSIDNGETDSLMAMLIDIASGITSPAAAFEEWTQIKESVDALMLKWADVEDVVAGSRGTLANAQHVAFYEAFTGQAYTQYGSTILGQEAALQIEKMYNYIKDFYTTQIVAQVIGALVYGDTAQYSLFTGKVEGEMNLTQEIIDDLQAQAAISGTPLEMWAQFAQFIGYTKGLDNLTTEEVTALDNAVAAMNDPNFTDWDDIVGRMTMTLGSIVEEAGDWGSTELIPDNTHNGTSGDDNIVGTANESNGINGYDGHDTLTGSTVADRINGGNGNDTLDGGGGDDYLIGGAGDDVYLYSSGNVTIDDNSGTDEIKIAAATGLTDQDIVDMFQTSDDLVIQLTGNRSIVIDGYFSSVNNRVEKITFLADSSFVQLDALSGIKTYGTSSSDLIHGVDASDDVIYGYNGNDRLWGEGGNDTLYGGNGADDLMGGDGDDTLDGGAGDDILSGDDPISNTSSNDTYIISTGYDYISESVGNDKIVFNGVANDIDLYGDGMGSLVIKWAGGETKVWSFFQQDGSEIETLEFTGSPSINLLTENILIKGTSDGDLISGAENQNVNQNETIYAYDGDDDINGGMGSDTIYAGDGNDIINGGTVYPAYMNDASNDYLDGGAGDDTYIVSDGSDTIVDSSGEDYIEVLSYFDYGMQDIAIPYNFHNLNMGMNGNNLEISFLGGTADITVLNHATNAVEYIYSDVYQTTISLENLGWITQANDDAINADTITGSYSGTGPSDPFDIIFAYAGDDIINAGNGYNLVFAGDGADTITSGTGDDELFGGLGNDTVYAGDGYDFVRGEEGDDVLYGEDGNDTLYGGYGADTLNGGDGDDYLDAFDSFYRDYWADFAYEPEDTAGNTLIGGLGNDILVGDAGDDVMQGGADDDTYRNIRGHDEITDTDGDNDAIEVLDRYVSEMTFTQDGNDLIIDLDGTATDTITIKNHFIAGNEVEWLDTRDYGRFNLITMQPDSINGAPVAQDDDFSVAFGQPIQGNVFADNGNGVDSDPESHDFYISTYHVTSVNGVGVNINSDGDFTYTPPADFVGTDSFEYEIRDAYGETDTATVTITVTAPVGALVGTSGDDTLSGSSSDDVIFGNDGNDTLNGNDGNDLIYGGDGNDLVNGGQGADTLMGGTGNDELNGGSGADTMIGGLGNDAYVVDDIDDVVTENANQGTDIVQSSIDYTLGANVENLTLTGSADLNGTGNDLANTITGNSGNNIISGGLGVDYLYGGAGNDTLDGGVGSDYMYGGDGDDVYIVGSATDHVTENASEGTDTVYASASHTLSNNVENLVLTGTALINGTGNALNNTITGNSASNTLSGGTGADTMIGLAGNDIYIVDNAGDVVVEAATQGTDTVRSSISYTLTDNVENLTLTGSSGLTGTGNALNNVITGNLGANTLDGGAGADTLIGGSGNDTYIVDNVGDSVVENASSGVDTVQASVSYTLSDYVENITLMGTGNINATGNSGANTLQGNSGINTLAGAAGDDVYIIDDANDILVENADEGNDIVQTSVSYALSDNIERITLTGSGNIDATGNALNNTLVGNSGNNTLDGGAGDDSMSGGTGDDTYIVDSMGDIVSESLSSGNDTVRASVSWTLGSNFENLVLTGAAAISGTGNTLANSIIGNSADNTLNGGTGADTLTGGLGNDTYVIDNAGDIVVEVSDEGIDLVQSSISYTLGDHLENLTLTGSSGLTGTGNALNNVITGNSGANTLNGGLGADTLAGGAGNDTYIVDNIDDVIVENDGEGTDIVQSSVSYTLSNYVERLTLTGSDNINATGNALNNTLVGNSGNNTLDGGAGNDSMSGGAGDDVYIVDSTSDSLSESSGAGTDTVMSSVTWTLGSNFENLVLTGADEINGTGNTLANTITGNSAANTLSGGTGADTLIGGAGDDTYIVDNVGDVVVENASEGTDTVRSSVSYVLGNYVENLTLTGSSGLSATGNALDNILTGNTGANTLDGGLGADTMSGGSGSDTYIVDNIGDIVIEASGGGTDTVNASISYTLTDNVEKLLLTGSADINGTGNALGNTLTGNSGNNILDGGAGNDTMIGGAGNDTYFVDSTSDVVTENANEGIDIVFASVTRTLGANFEHLTLTGSSAINGTGNTLDNILTGNSGANTLSGGAGNDTLYGGDGADTLNGNDNDDILYGQDGLDILWGNLGADTFVFEAASAYNNIDVVKDFSLAQNDKIDISDLLSAYDPLTDVLSDYVMIADSGSNSVVSIDRDGAGSTYGWTQIATLEGITGLTNVSALEASGNLIVQ